MKILLLMLLLIGCANTPISQRYTPIEVRKINCFIKLVSYEVDELNAMKFCDKVVGGK